MSEVLTNAVQTLRPCLTQSPSATPDAAFGSGTEVAGSQRDATGKAVAGTPMGIAPRPHVAACGLASAGSTTDASQPRNDRRAVVRLSVWDPMAAWRRRHFRCAAPSFAVQGYPPASSGQLAASGPRGRPSTGSTDSPATPTDRRCFA